MKEIQLTQNQVALVDDWWFEKLNQFKWYSSESWNGTYYARRDITMPSGKQRHIGMSRFILGLKYNDKRMSDHINHCSLDNREVNLRICTRNQNAQNQKPQKRQTSTKYKGVCWHKTNKMYTSCITINGVRKHLGSFKNKRIAALVYDLNAKKYFGEYALTNF